MNHSKAVAGSLGGMFLWLMLLSGEAPANPGSAFPCTSCHTESTGKLSVSGNDSTAALSGRLDGGTNSLLKVFTVVPGGEADITFNMTDSSAVLFDPVIANLGGGGVKNSMSNKLSFTADPTWVLSVTGPPAYVGFAMDGVSTPTSFVYHLKVGSETPTDYYSLALRISGIDPGPVRWTQGEEVYLHVVSVPEPAVWVLVGIGLVALLGLSRGQRAQNMI